MSKLQHIFYSSWMQLLGQNQECVIQDLIFSKERHSIGKKPKTEWYMNKKPIYLQVFLM